jgi:hypothetical protein
MPVVIVGCVLFGAFALTSVLVEMEPNDEAKRITGKRRSNRCHQ